ncbi:hypothetical protein D3C84_1234560 [compost metagenome]
MHKFIIPISKLRIFVHAPAPQAAILLLHNHMPSAVLDLTNIRGEQHKAWICRHGIPGNGCGIDLVVKRLDD